MPWRDSTLPSALRENEGIHRTASTESMKKIFASLALLFLIAAGNVWGQQEGEQPLSTDTLGSALSYEFRLDFDIVFKGVKNALEGLGYEVNYASKKKRLIETNFKQLATEDDFYDTMSEYGDVPYMRSPGWTIGRVKVNISFEEIDSVRTGINVLAQLSGFEERFTNIWHYWGSNGRIEQEVMQAIIAKLEGP